MKVGYLPQEPALDPTKTVQGNVMEALAETKAVLDRFEAVSTRLGEVEDPDEMMALIEEQAELQEKIEAADAWDLDARSKSRWMRYAARRATGRSRNYPAASDAGSLCAVFSLKSPTFFCWTNRQTIWTRNPWRGWKGRFRNIPARSSW